MGRASRKYFHSVQAGFRRSPSRKTFRVPLFSSPFENQGAKNKQRRLRLTQKDNLSGLARSVSFLSFSLRKGATPKPRSLRRSTPLLSSSPGTSPSMMWTAVALALLAASAVSAQTANEFQANVRIYNDPQVTSGGLWEGCGDAEADLGGSAEAANGYLNVRGTFVC
jgi:hypothetical protein